VIDRLLIEVFDDEHLKKLLSDSGFLLNIDYPTRNVKLHRITCMHCNPDNSVAVKPSTKRENKTGEIWFSDKRKEANSKAIEISEKRGFRYSFCLTCKP
jgi:hypothetical protein